MTSAALARFLAGSSWDRLPGEVQAEARRGLMNFAGCLVAGQREPEIRLLREALPGEQAVADAAAATAHDYDDTHQRTVIHATPPVGSAVLAVCRQKTVTGKEMLHAFAAGVETTCRIGNAVMPGHYEKGWHITSTCGIFGAAVAAGKLLGLDDKRMLACLGIAATQAAGLVEMLGSTARVLNAGFAARNGVVAAKLAAAGYEGPAQPLEGLRGFLNVFGGSRDLEALTGALGERWEMRNVSYKPYPCGVVLHALIDACFELEDRGAQRYTVRMHPLAMERTDRPEPANATLARLSAYHAVAVVMLRGRAGLEEFSDSAAADPQIAAFRRRVRVVRDDTLDKMEAVVSDGVKTVRMKEARPMDDARLEAKFCGLAGGRAQRILKVLDELPSLSDARPLAHALEVP